MLQRTQGEAHHILSFAQRLQGGGVERALMRLALGWQRAGSRVTLIIGDGDGPLAREIPEGVTVHRLNDGSYAALARAVADIARRERPDILFCPGNHYSAVAGFVRLKLGRGTPPIVAKISNALVRPDMSGLSAWSYRRWLRLHRRFLDHVVAMTPATAAEARREMRLPSDRVSVIPNPPAVPIPGAPVLALPDRPFLLGIGRLEPQKRWDRLIEALPLLERGDVRLLILGEGSLRGALEAQVAALGLASRVSLPGHAADPLPALRDAAVLALTSDYEGVPGVIREALALGTPVVATESSVAVRELIAGPGHGDVVARDDRHALVTALDRWLRPDAVRPGPVGPDGSDPVSAYLDLFDRIAQRAPA